MGRTEGTGRYSARTNIQIEPAMRRRVERIAKARQSHFSVILREAINLGLPVLERELLDRQLAGEEVAS